MKFKSALAAIALTAAAQTIGAQAMADTIFVYTFDAGSYFDFGGGNSYAAVGSFSYDAITQAVTNVTYSGVQTGTGPVGPFNFTAATATPFSVTFTGDCCGDIDTYYFMNSLALGGADPIIGAAYIGSPISGGGSVTAAVPEPSTWAMMLAGFGGLGFLGYRRNKSAFLA